MRETVVSGPLRGDAAVDSGVLFTRVVDQLLKAGSL